MFHKWDYKSPVNHILAIILSLFFSTPIFAASSILTQRSQSCMCSATSQDNLEEPQSFNFGKFKGQCIDSCRFRPALILSKLDDIGDGNKIEVGNILHYGGFYQGTLALNNIDSVQVGFEEFLPGVYHVFLQFHVKDGAEPIVLRSQTDSTKKIAVYSLVLSPEGVPPKGRKYSIFESYFGHYLLANRLVTGDEMVRWTKELKHPLKMFSLKLPKNRVGKVLFQGLRQSHELGLQNVYQLFSNNCSTSVLGLIDHELRRGVSQGWTKLEEALPIVGPIGTLRALMERKLVDSQLLL